MATFSSFRGITSFFTSLLLFHIHSDTTKTICPSLPALQTPLFPSVKCTQYHVVEVISPTMWLLPPVLSLSNRRRYTPYMHACMCMFFIYLCAEQTPRCVSLVSCVMMMKGTCCSQQKPLSTLRYWHPACIIHSSRVVIQSLLRVSDSVTCGWSKLRTTQWVRALMKPSTKRDQGNNVDDFLAALYDVTMCAERWCHASHIQEVCVL